MKFKIFTFVIALVTLAGLGLVYGWSIFVVPLEAEFGWPRSETSLTFTISMIAVCIGIMISGQFNKKKDRPVASLLISAVLILAGFIMTSRADVVMDFYIYYGVFCGFGVGFAYVEIIAVMTRWFTKSQGVITGLMMMIYGMGAMIFGTVCSKLMEIIGWRVTFMGLGVLFGALLIILGFMIAAGEKFVAAEAGADAVQDAKSDEAEAPTLQVVEDVTAMDMIKKKEFFFLYLYCMLLSAAGLAVMGHIAPCVMEMGIGAATAALVAGATSTSNGLGRLIYGISYDKLGVSKTMYLTSGVFMLATLIAAAGVMIGSVAVLTVGCCLLGMSFGAAPTTSSIVTNFFFGKKYFSANFGIITTQLIFAAFIGPFLAGKLYTTSGTYAMTFYAFIALGVLAVIIAVMTARSAKNIEKAA